MARFTFLMVLFIGQALYFSVAMAGDFGWLDNLNVKAEADSSGFRYKLSTRFKVGDAEVKAVLSNVDRPSDAYMVLRLGELSRHSTREVINVYRSHRNKGWGVIAKNLGIKPGSSEFHALKRGHDLGDNKGASHAGGGNKDKHSKGNSGKGNAGKGNHKKNKGKW